MVVMQETRSDARTDLQAPMEHGVKDWQAPGACYDVHNIWCISLHPFGAPHCCPHGWPQRPRISINAAMTALFALGQRRLEARPRPPGAREALHGVRPLARRCTRMASSRAPTHRF